MPRLSSNFVIFVPFVVQSLLWQKGLAVCLLICLRQSDGSLLLAANRDERYDRPSSSPLLWGGKPRLWAGRDDQAGGTWLAVNEHGVVAAVTNRPIDVAPPKPTAGCTGQTPATRAQPPSTGLPGDQLNRPSRGGLPLLACRQATAKAAAMKTQEHLRGVAYNGFNLLIADRAAAYIVQNTGQPVLDSVSVGMHVMANRGWDDLADERVALAFGLIEKAGKGLHSGDTAQALEAMQSICRFHGQRGEPSLCIHSSLGGTVSSTLLAVSGEGKLLSYLFCPAAPCRGQYEELAGVLF